MSTNTKCALSAIAQRLDLLQIPGGGERPLLRGRGISDGEPIGKEPIDHKLMHSGAERMESGAGHIGGDAEAGRKLLGKTEKIVGFIAIGDRLIRIAPEDFEQRIEGILQKTGRPVDMRGLGNLGDKMTAMKIGLLAFAHDIILHPSGMFDIGNDLLTGESERHANLAVGTIGAGAVSTRIPAGTRLASPPISMHHSGT